MAVTSKNLQLILPEQSDNISSLVFYENFQKIDSAILANTGGKMTGGINLSGYSEQTNTMTGVSIEPAKGTVFVKSITSATTFTLDTTGMVSNYTYSFTLVISMGNDFYDVTFPANITWAEGEAPNFDINTTTEIILRSYDNGTTWYGSIGGVFGVSS